jgi:hypothetical protein
MAWCAALVASSLASLLASSVMVPTAAAQPTPGALPPVLSLRVDVIDLPGVPLDAIGLALNVTVTNPVAAGFLTVFPCSSGRPVASNVNYVAGQTVPNFVVSGIDEFGGVCIETMATTDVIVDLAGYVPFGSPLTMLPAPVRFADTRVPGDRAGIRLRAGETRAVQIAGSPGVPADASAVVFNATAVAPDRDGFLTVFPCGRATPATSTLNFTRGAVVPNLVTTAVGVGGAVCFYAIADVDLVADVAAYVPAGGTGITLLAAPERIFDTRSGLGGPAAALGAEPRPVQVVGRAGVPAGATAAIVNLTATEGTGAGFVAAFPCGSTPLVSSLNFAAGQNIANAAIVKLAPDGTMCLRSNAAVQAVVDIAGYLMSATAIVPVDPVRVADTREDAAPVCNLGVVQVGSGWQWIDLGTGVLGAVFRTPPPLQGTSHVDISPDCATAMIVNNRTMHLIDRAGVSVSATPLPAAVLERFMFVSDQGPLAVVGGRTPGVALSLVDVATNAVLLDFVGLDTRLGWTFAGAARTQSVFMFFARTATGAQEFHVLDYNGFEVAIFTLPAGAEGYDVSPSGVYMSYFVRRAPGGPDQFGPQQIVTSAGDPVEVHPAGGVQEPNWGVGWWLSDGRGASCTYARPGSTERVTVFVDLFAANRVTTMPCVTAAL